MKLKAIILVLATLNLLMDELNMHKDICKIVPCTQISLVLCSILSVLCIHLKFIAAGIIWLIITLVHIIGLLIERK